MRPGTIALLLTAAAIVPAGGTVANAHEFKPSWGYAFIDDHPFNDPDAGGALLPSTQVFPRGHIRDTLVDNRDVRMTVLVFTPGTGNPATRYSVNEGDFQNVTINRRLDIAPFQVSYLRYDFCRFNPSNGAVEVCEEFHRIGRPDPPPEPTPTPTPGPGGGTPLPSPVDRDGDGSAEPADCWDFNATVFPGAKEVAGNGVDDDCAGGDAPGRLTATVKHNWRTAGRRVRVIELRVVDGPAGALVEVTCSGKRCPFKRKATTVNAKGNAQLRKFFRKRLRPKITIDVRITQPNSIGKVVRFPLMRADVPPVRRLCLPPGKIEPERC